MPPDRSDTGRYSSQSITPLFKGQHLDLGPTPVNKYKPLTTGRVLQQMVLDLRRQTIERTPHIGWFQAQPDSLAWRDTQHGRRRRKNTSAPSCSSTSHAEVTGEGVSGVNSTNIGSSEITACVNGALRSFVLQRSKLLNEIPCSIQNCFWVCSPCLKRAKSARHCAGLRLIPTTFSNVYIAVHKSKNPPCCCFSGCGHFVCGGCRQLSDEALCLQFGTAVHRTHVSIQ